VKPPTERTTTMNNMIIAVAAAEATGLWLAIGIFLAIGFVIAIFFDANKGKRNLKTSERLIAEAQGWAASVKESGLLSISSSIILKNGEVAFYEAPSALYETRAVRYSTGGGLGFRVARGVYVGGGASRSLSEQEWTQVDTGTLTVTNKRLVFNGARADRVVPIAKIVSASVASLSQVEVSAEGRQKSMMFDAANPIILSTIFDSVCKNPVTFEPVATPPALPSNNGSVSREQLQSWWKKLHGTDHCVLS
jgi:hypothetical protein